MRVTKKQRLIDFIASKPEGVTYGEAQRFVVEELSGGNYDSKQPEHVYDWKSGTTRLVMRRTWRGWWADHLTGPKGILTNYCNKVNGRYVIKGTSA